MMLHNQQDLYLLGLALPFVIVTAPLLVELLVLTLAAISFAAEPAPASLPPVHRLIVLIPSHNEEGNIARCVQSVAASAGSFQDILVVAHNCTDATAVNARAAGATVSELSDPALPGKGNALAHGFHVALQEMGADAVMIIDADSTISSNLVSEVRRRLQSTAVLQCQYQCLSDASSRSRLRALAFFCMNVVRPRGRNRLRLSSGIFGNGFALRCEVLEHVPYNAHSVVEDLEFHLALVSAGYFCDFVSNVRVLAEVPVGSRGATTQSARWEGGRIRMATAHGPRLLSQVLRGRLVLMEPLIDLFGLPLAMEVLGLCLLLLIPLAAIRIYAACGFAILILHLMYGVLSGPDPAADLRALLDVPSYVASKARMLPQIVRTAHNRAAWIRTSRSDSSK